MNERSRNVSMFPKFDAIRCHTGQVNDAFLIAGYLEEHLGFSKENAIDLAWVEFRLAHSPLHGFESAWIDLLLRFVCCMTFCRGRGETYRPMVFASDGAVCNVGCSFQKRTGVKTNTNREISTWHSN